MTGAIRPGEASFAKGVELLHELLPQAGSITRVAMPTSYYAFSQPLQESFSQAAKEAENTARTLGLRLNVLEASNSLEIEQAFASVAEERSGGLLVDSNGNFYDQRDQFVALAARYRVPTIYSWREAVEAGGLMSYGASVDEMLRIAVSGHDPLMPPAESRPLTKLKEIKVTASADGEYEIASDWSLRHLRQPFAYVVGPISVTPC